MKIAFLGPGYPLRGGIAQFIAILSAKLQAKEQEVKIFSFKKQYPKLLFPGKEQLEKSKLFLDLPIDSTLIPYNPFTFKKTIKKIEAFEPDILILKYWIPFFAPAFGYIIKKLKQKGNMKILYIMDNIDFHEKWLGGDLLTKYALRNSDYFITMSDSVNNSLFKLFPKLDKSKVHKLNHPTYDFYASNKTKSFAWTKRILFFGYVKPYKGLDLLLEAMPTVLKSLPELKLEIAGEVYGNESQYSDLIKKHGLEKNVTLHNRYISNEDVEKFFTASDICVLPYKQATQSGIIQLSYAFGVPVIATAVGGIPEVIKDGETGYLIPANDVQAIALAIINFYQENRLEQFYHNILKEQEKYSWEPFLQVITAL